MNEKLIRRAAIRYRDWMVKQTNEPPLDASAQIFHLIESSISKIEEFKKWNSRFRKGTIHSCRNAERIVNRGVYRQIATTMMPNIGEEIIRQIQSATSMTKEMAEDSSVVPLTIKEAIDEVTIINNEWEEVEFRNNMLSFMIENVSLSDEEDTVDLGAFAIYVDLSDPLGKIVVKSVDEVESSNGYYHPHVDEELLCTGDGDEAMEDAISQGRLEDYIRIIEAVLRTYNSRSPHEELAKWYAPDRENQFCCSACEEWYDNDMGMCCHKCNSVLCEGCTQNGNGNTCSECGDWHCSDCVEDCGGDYCENTICDRCSKQCMGDRCTDSFCSDCLNECTGCGYAYCESCTDSCTNCSDTLCDECAVVCRCCDERYCSSCLKDEGCSGCGKEELCTSCGSNSCEHCGVLMCEPCEEKHDCLLEGINNG